MRVLVTGSHGYIGSVLAPIVAGAGHDVVGLDTCFYRGCDFGATSRAIATVQRDVRDVTAADFEGFDAVVHLAALSNDPIGDLNEQWTYDINLDATLRVAREAKAAGVAAVRLRLVLLDVRRVGDGRPARRGGAAPAR